MGLFVLAVIAAIAAIVLGGLAMVRSHAARWPRIGLGLLAVGAALLLVQITPWPRAVLDTIAPHTQKLLPIWQGEAAERLGLGRWSTVSLAPEETRGALIIFLSYAILFAATTVRIRRVEHIERILRWCAIAAVLMAIFGLVQFALSNGMFFWFYSHPFSTTTAFVKGSFTNRNHFAGFLALGIGPLVWWLAHLDCPSRRKRSPSDASFRIPTGSRIWLRAMMLGVVALAVLLSLSRGGIAATALAFAVAAAMMLRVYPRGSHLLCGLGAVGLFVLCAWMVFGGQSIDARIETVASGSMEEIDPGNGRRLVWSGVLQAIPTFLPFGSGAGSFQTVVPMVVDDPLGDALEYTHAESSYLQIALEDGLFGLLLVIAGIALAAAWCLRGFRQDVSVRTRACIGAVAASLAAFVLHGTADCLWYVPACAATISVLAACAWSASTLQAGPVPQPSGVVHRPPIARWLRFACLPLALCLGGWLIADRSSSLFAEPAMDEYLRLSQAAYRNGQSPKPMEDAWNRISILSRTVACDRSNARAHMALAEEHLALFDRIQAASANVMTLRNIRDAAVRAKFSNAETLDAWLKRSVGVNRVHLHEALHHAREAVRQAPLEGRAYVCLARVAFIEAPSDPDSRALLDQALVVRPYEGTVLYAAANEAIFQGDATRWADLVQRTIQCGPTWQTRVIVDLLAAAPQEAVPQVAREFVSLFHPNLSGLRLLSRLCLRVVAPCDVSFLDRLYAEAAAQHAAELDGREAASVWLEAEACHARLGDPERALRCARQAYSAAPEDFDVRRRFAFALVDEEKWDEAEEHLRWCAERRPHDAPLQAKFREALSQRVARQSALRDTRTIPR